MSAENLIKFAAATNNELFDAEYNGGEWMVEAVETHETLEQFIESAANWAERSAMVRGEIAGLPFVMWKRVQLASGHSRRSVSVVDLGDMRIILDQDLSVF